MMNQPSTDEDDDEWWRASRRRRGERGEKKKNATCPASACVEDVVPSLGSSSRCACDARHPSVGRLTRAVIGHFITRDGRRADGGRIEDEKG